MCRGEVYFRVESIIINNCNNLCKIEKRNKELLCGDFNAHNWLWGSITIGK